MEKTTKIIAGSALATVVVVGLIYVGGDRFAARAAPEPDPGFSVTVEAAALSVLVTLNERRVELVKDGHNEWTGEATIGVKDVVRRVLDIRSAGGTQYKLEIKYFGDTVEEVEGTTTGAKFRNPATGHTLIQLKPRDFTRR